MIVLLSSLTQKKLDNLLIMPDDVYHHEILRWLGVTVRPVSRVVRTGQGNALYGPLRGARQREADYGEHVHGWQIGISTL